MIKRTAVYYCPLTDILLLVKVREGGMLADIFGGHDIWWTVIWIEDYPHWEFVGWL